MIHTLSFKTHQDLLNLKGSEDVIREALFEDLTGSLRGCESAVNELIDSE